MAMAMAMGGGHKGNGNGNGNRGKPYGLMLLLAFGVALLGVMTLQKLRERRIFNLLVQDKSRHLISLQLLLQVSFSLHHARNAMLLLFTCHSLPVTHHKLHAFL